MYKYVNITSAINSTINIGKITEFAGAALAKDPKEGMRFYYLPCDPT